MVLKEHQSPEAEGSLLDNDSSSQDHCLKFGGCELRALKRYRSGAFPVVQDRSAGGAILANIFGFDPFTLKADERNDLSKGFEVAATNFFTRMFHFLNSLFHFNLQDLKSSKD
jgi:hypothetical protein